jgi:glutaredoxin 3
MDVTIYSTTTCSFCHALYSWLDDNNVKFKKIMTDEDSDGMEKFLEVCDGSIAVPLTVITDNTGQQTKIVGFDRKKLKAVLNIE